MSFVLDVHQVLDNPYPEFSSLFVAHLLHTVGRTLDDENRVIFPCPLHIARDLERGDVCHTMALHACPRRNFLRFFTDEIAIREGSRRYYITHTRNFDNQSHILSTIRSDPFSTHAYTLRHAIRDDEVVVQWHIVGLPHMLHHMSNSLGNLDQPWEDYFKEMYDFESQMREREGVPLVTEDRYIRLSDSD